MPAGDYLTRGIMDLIRRIVREEVTKSKVTAVTGGGYTVAQTVNGVVAHAHDSAAHTGLTTDNHHAEIHAIDGADHTFPEGAGTTFLNDQGDFTTPAGTGTPTLADVLAEGNSVGGFTITGEPVGGLAGVLDMTDAHARLVYDNGVDAVAKVNVNDTQAQLIVEDADSTQGFFVAGGVGVADGVAGFGTAGQVLTAVGDDTAVWADATGGAAVFEWENA